MDKGIGVNDAEAAGPRLLDYRAPTPPVEDQLPKAAYLVFLAIALTVAALYGWVWWHVD